MKKIAASTKNFRDKLGGVQGAVGGIGGALAIGAIGRTLLRFEKSMNKIKAVTGASAETMQKMRDEAKRLGSTTFASINQVAEGMGELALSGSEADEILSRMPSTLALAAAGNMEIKQSADFATDVLQQFNAKAEDFTRIADIMAAGSTNASTEISQLGEGLRNTGSISSFADISLEETTGYLMGLAEGGAKAGMGGTLFMNMLRGMVNPTRKARRELRRYGIDMRKFVERGKVKDMMGFLEELKEKEVDLGSFFKAFEIRGARAVATLVRILPKVRAFIELLHQSRGEVRRMADTMLEGFPKVVAEFSSSIERASLAMGEALLPTFTMLLTTSTEFFRSFSNSSPVLLKWIGIIFMLGTALAAILIPMAILTAAVGVIFTKVGAVVAGITVAISGVVALMSKWEESKEGIKSFFGNEVPLKILEEAREKNREKNIESRRWLEGQIEVYSRTPAGVGRAILREFYNLDTGKNLATINDAPDA